MDATTNPEFDKWWQDWLSAIHQRHAQLEGVSGASRMGAEGARHMACAAGFSCVGAHQSPAMEGLGESDS